MQNKTEVIATDFSGVPSEEPGQFGAIHTFIRRLIEIPAAVLVVLQIVVLLTDVSTRCRTCDGLDSDGTSAFGGRFNWSIR